MEIDFIDNATSNTLASIVATHVPRPGERVYFEQVDGDVAGSWVVREVSHRYNLVNRSAPARVFVVLGRPV